MSAGAAVKGGVVFSTLGVVTILALGEFRTAADLEVSATVQIHAKAEFETPLAPHGTWLVVSSYGRCWRPAGVAVEWRPYGCGTWVWTECGWYWASDEPWAWACYHYGWWVQDSKYGWVWVPNTDWAPAWVSWRAGPDFIGWAPLGPPGFFGMRAPKGELFVFVGLARFTEPVKPALLVVHNHTVFSVTSAVGGVKRQTLAIGGAGAQPVMVNQGPRPEAIQKASGKTLKAISIAEALRHTHGPPESKRMETSSKEAHNDNPGQQGHESARWGDDSAGKEPGSSGPEHTWSSFGPGNARDNGGGVHGKRRGER
jgi:hypothetical protein